MQLPRDALVAPINVHREEAAAVCQHLRPHHFPVGAGDRQAGHLVRAKESAADLAQSVCREVLERIGDGRFEYQGEAAFKQWLFQAAEHKMQNKHRFYRADRRDGAKEVRPAGDDDSAGTQDLPGRVTSPSMRAIRAEDRLALDTPRAITLAAHDS